MQEFNKQDFEHQNALIRLGYYSIMSRAGFDVSEVNEQLREDRETCRPLIGDKELLFSPDQILSKTRVAQAFPEGADESSPKNAEVLNGPEDENPVGAATEFAAEAIAPR
ncbi:hypothetical protein CEH02_08655, partial [Streptococcus pyogenes]